MNVLVIGSSGGSGRAAVRHLLARGHRVTTFSRSPSGQQAAGLRALCGDVTNQTDVDAAVAGQDAVVVTLGISENPLRVRLLGPARTPADVRSAGTRHVVRAMRKQGVRRLVVQSSYGVGETRDKLRWVEALFFKLILKPQIDDTELQEGVVKQSGLDWVIAQPVHLTDEPDAGPATASAEGEVAKLSVSRDSVGAFLADAVESSALSGCTLSLS